MSERFARPSEGPVDYWLGLSLAVQKEGVIAATESPMPFRDTRIFKWFSLGMDHRTVNVMEYSELCCRRLG